MLFDYQADAISTLKQYAESDKHSVFIVGNPGTGKSYLAREYSRMLGIDDFVVVKPTIDELNDMINAVSHIDNRVCICIENLDVGVAGAAYAILKFVEEPQNNVYIVITCRNIDLIPPTILSRCMGVVVGHPSDSERAEYCKINYFEDYARLKNHLIYKCIRTFADANIIMKLKSDELEYFNGLKDVLSFSAPVSSILYTLSHYPNKSKSPINIVLTYLLFISDDAIIGRYTIECLDAINTGRVADWCALAMYVMQCKKHMLK